MQRPAGQRGNAACLVPFAALARYHRNMNTLLLSFSLICGTAFAIWFCHKPASGRKSLVKTTSVAALALIAILNDAPAALIAGLLFGAVGDYFLSRDGTPAFLTGLIAFALGHFAYAVLIWQSGAVVMVTVPVLIMVGFAAAVGAILVPRAGRLAWPVAGYIALIAAMCILALGLPDGHRLGLTAALMFAGSDALLGVSLFVLAATWRHNWPLSVAIWSLYFGAQLLFLCAFGAVWQL